MARTNTLGNFLTDVADAIREKKGTSETIQASDFDTEIVNLPSSGGLDWTALGYSGQPQIIEDDYSYSKNIYDNWNPSTTSMVAKFQNDKNLVYMPLVDTSNVTNMASAFNGCAKLRYLPELNTSNVTVMGSCFVSTLLETFPLLDTSNVTSMAYMFMACSALKTVPLLNTSNVTSFSSMFSNCIALTDTSLDNILKMCINATSYTGTKKLTELGITNTSIYTDSRIQALPHYQDFINAGWTIR